MTESFINKNGTLPRTMTSIIVDYMRRTKGKLITITYKAVLPTRSLLQNKYYWGVVIKILSKEIGYAPDYMHEYMKQEFLWTDDQDMPDGKTAKITHDTKNLTTVQFEDYIYKIRQWADEFLMIDIPLPNQTQFDYTGYE